MHHSCSTSPCKAVPSCIGKSCHVPCVSGRAQGPSHAMVLWVYLPTHLRHRHSCWLDASCCHTSSDICLESLHQPQSRFMKGMGLHYTCVTQLGSLHVDSCRTCAPNGTHAGRYLLQALSISTAVAVTEDTHTLSQHTKPSVQVAQMMA